MDRLGLASGGRYSWEALVAEMRRAISWAISWLGHVGWRRAGHGREHHIRAGRPRFTRTVDAHGLCDLGCAAGVDGNGAVPLVGLAGHVGGFAVGVRGFEGWGRACRAGERDGGGPTSGWARQMFLDHPRWGRTVVAMRAFAVMAFGSTFWRSAIRGPAILSDGTIVTLERSSPE